MLNYRLSRLVCTTAFLAALATTTACTTLQNAYDSVDNSLSGGKEYQASPTKVEVKSPAAAPVQDVNAQEITANKPVELGRVTDSTLNPSPEAKNVAPIVPTAQNAAPAAAPTAAPAAAPAPVASNTVALLTIRFNQPHVYYDDALVQSVGIAEKAKPGVTYEVLSTIPDLSSLAPDMQEKLSARAKDNLRNVVVKMQQQGITADRIRIAEQTLKIRSQEIRVFVR